MPEGQAMLTQTLFKQLDALHDDLHLSPAQEVLWQTARVKSQQTERDIRDNNRQFTRWSERELASETPRLSELSTALDELLQKNQSLHKEVRRLWLGCYDSLARQQKLIVRDALQRQLARLKTFQQMRDFFGRN
jgi:periplasmic protein CpxP/Spy